jgi:hypothetical protein
MAASKCARVRLWRWRRSPLKRRCDVVEAWLVLFGWVLALAGALFGGRAAADAVERSAQEQRAHSHEVSAVLVEDANDSGPSTVTTDHRVWATVRWTAPDGTKHTDQARVAPKTKAGTEVSVWTDQRGAVTSQPLAEGEVVLHSVASGVLAGAGAAGVVLGSVWCVRLGLERRRMAQWAAEWERIDTRRGWKTP